MHQITPTTDAALPRQSRVAVVVQLAFIGVVLSLATIVATTLLQTDHVTSRAQLSLERYGFPFAWATQDQSPLTPPMPAAARFADPRDVATSTSETPLLVDFALVAVAPAVLYGGCVGGGALWRRRRQAAPTRHLTLA